VSAASKPANVASRSAAFQLPDRRCLTSHARTRKVSVWLLALALVILGCESATAPVPNQRRLYVLADVDGQPLPAVMGSQVGDTDTVLWATVTLDAAGHAVLMKRYRHAYLAYPPDTSTSVSEMNYLAAGDSITVGFFGPCMDLCAPNLVGQLTDSVLTLTYDVTPRFDPLYRYQLSATY
jgi:hypothetical protein